MASRIGVPFTRLASRARPRARSAPPSKLRAKSTASRLRPLATRRFELLVRGALPAGLVLSREVGVEQLAEAIDLSAAREHPGLTLDVLGTTVGLGGAREIAQSLEIRRRLRELRAPRRRHRDRHSARQDRQGARPSHASRLIRSPRPLEEPHGSHEVAAKLRAAREREGPRPSTEDPVEKIGQAQDLPCPPRPLIPLLAHRRTRSLARGPLAVKLRPHGQ